MYFSGAVRSLFESNTLNQLARTSHNNHIADILVRWDLGAKVFSRALEHARALVSHIFF